MTTRYDMRNDLNPRRVTNAMWDYSWLCGHYPGGPFADWSLALEELLARGFNTVRIEAFPWIIGRQKSDDETITMPGAPLATWGASDVDRKHAVARELIEFIGLCRKKGVCVILSTWGKGCLEYPGTGAVNPPTAYDEMVQVWERTLDLLQRHELFDTILYVDLDQEFPYFSAHGSRLAELAGARRDAGDPMAAAGQRKAWGGLQWNDAQMAFVAGLFNRSLSHFQARYPGLRFTISLTGFWEEVRALRLRCMDVLELHCWIHGPRFDNRSGFNRMQKDRGTRSYLDYQCRVDAAFAAVRPMLLHEMHQRLQFAEDWGNEISAPVITTEAWGPWWHMDHPDLRWDWLRDWCADCAGIAAERKFWGVTTWNYAHPYWANWADVAWYQKVNSSFLAS